MKTKILALTVLSLGMNAFSQAQNIDGNLKKCLDKAVSTASQRECTTTAENSWDAEMNRNYKILISKLPADARKNLQESQRKWLAFRDAEFGFISKYNFEVKSGTLFHVIADNQRMNLVKNRAEQLREFAKMIDD